MKTKTNPPRNRAVTGLLLSMLAIAGCASSGARPAVADAKTTPAGPATRSELLQPGITPLQPNANPTDAELRDYWERTIVRPLRSGRLRGRVVTKSGRPMEGIRVETVLTQWSARGRNPAFPESVVVTDANGTFDLPAEAPRRNEQFMLHVQQLPYILQVWQLGLVGAGQPDARAKRSRGEGTLAFNTAFDPVAARAMLARGELMPSTAIEGGVDVVVRRLADDEQYAKDAARPMDTLEDVTRGGKHQIVVDEAKRFPNLKEGDVLLTHVVRLGIPSDQAAVLIRAPVDGYYSVGMIDLLGPNEINAERTHVTQDVSSGGEFVRKNDLIGFVRDATGRVHVASRQIAPVPKAELYDAQFRVWVEPRPITYAWVFRRARPSVE